ncbi:hypothetical protein PLICRDRAFT_694498 [Plicaturopsis crispa FD-325 SS-3]|nr:hypothetical protein PLICRDRAFT_694498 [Plicaturopsis crispa FD-325 SS-3]
MPDEGVSLVTPDTKIKVSSTLDKSVGKKYLTDDSPETCWTSQQGTPQYIQLQFPHRVLPTSLSITFQGGFVGTRCSVTAISSSESPGAANWVPLTSIYPEDVNRRQSFDLDTEALSEAGEGVQGLKIVFEESSDFFGRITVYDIKIFGTVLE